MFVVSSSSTIKKTFGVVCKQQKSEKQTPKKKIVTFN